MKKLFNILPVKFFSPLTSIYQEVYSDIIFRIYEIATQNNSYTFLKDDLVDLIEDYFLEEDIEIIEDERKIKTARDKATYIFRKLKLCGWIDEEYAANQQIIVNLEDYAIAFLNTYANFNETNTFELSSYVYGIYQNMKNFDLSKGYLTLSDTISKSKNLLNKLGSLNSNIKKYIKKIVKINHNDEESLKNILKDLSEYKTNIIDNAYFYMKTNDNPLKYKREFLELCQKRKTPIERVELINQIQKDDSTTIELAQDKLTEMLDYLENVFELITNIMEEIDRKNTRYINVSIERIKIILNNDSNTEGMLLNILKNYHLLKSEELIFNISNIKQLTNQSLYTPKKIVKVTPKKFLTVAENDKELDNLIKRQMKETLKYSKININKYIENKLRAKKRLNQDDFDIASKEDFIRLILVFIYSNDTLTNYHVIFNEEKVKINKVLIPSFTIERKNADDRKI